MIGVNALPGNERSGILSTRAAEFLMRAVNTRRLSATPHAARDRKLT